MTLNSDLKEPVEGDPEEEDVGEELEQVEDAVDDPVGQPLGVVVLLRRLDGLDASTAATMQISRTCVKPTSCQVQWQPKHNVVCYVI